jgi:hypothetical protein
VVHAYNPSYSGDRDQEDCGLKPAWANSLRDSILGKQNKTKITKNRAGRVAQGIDPVFQPQYCKTNKKTNKQKNTHKKQRKKKKKKSKELG